MKPATALQVGDSLEGCEIIAPLRAGGMATLFLGRRRGVEGFARKVAVKVVHPHLASDPGFTAMFIDEAKLCSRIHHPNVVQVEAFGRHEDKYYLIMEFVDSCSLHQLLFDLRERELRLSPPMAVNIIMGVLDGLHAAHEATDAKGRPLNIVHRDVSPSNVLLAYQGPVKLIDFGVAKAEGRSQETDAGHIKGKFNYMAPEQARAESIDRRVDVYAAALILWEMLTQRRYNDGATPMESLTTAITPSGVSARALLPSLDRKLNKVLMRALSAEPSRRPATAREFRRQLGEVCPKALAIDDQDRSEFVVSVMQSYMRLQAAKLPQDITGIFGRADESEIDEEVAEQRLSTHTALLEDVVAEIEAGASRRTLTTAAGSLPKAPVPREPAPAPKGKGSVLPWLLLAVLVGATILFLLMRPSATVPAEATQIGETQGPEQEEETLIVEEAQAEPAANEPAETESPEGTAEAVAEPSPEVSEERASRISNKNRGAERSSARMNVANANSRASDAPSMASDAREPTQESMQAPPSRLRDVGGTRLLSNPEF